MHIPVHSPWLPGYIDVTQTVLIILTLAGLPKAHALSPGLRTFAPAMPSAWDLKVHLFLPATAAPETHRPSHRLNVLSPRRPSRTLPLSMEESLYMSKSHESVGEAKGLESQRQVLGIFSKLLRMC